MDSERAGRLIRAAFPDLSVRSVVPFREGWANTVFLVNQSTLFRFPKTVRVAASTRKEIAILPALASASLPLPTPNFRFAAPDGALDYPWAFAGYSLLPGTPAANLERGQLSPAVPGAIGDFLTALHRFPADRAAALGVPGGTAQQWRSEYRSWFVQTRPLIWPYLNGTQQQAVVQFIEAFLSDDRNFRFRPVLLHHDLSEDHLLIDLDTGQANGIIDFQDAVIGDPCFDLLGVIHLGPGVLDHYRGPIDPGFFERMRFYTRLRPLHELCHGAKTGNWEHIEKGLSRLRADLGG